MSHSEVSGGLRVLTSDIRTGSYTCRLDETFVPGPSICTLHNGTENVDKLFLNYLSN